MGEIKLKLSKMIMLLQEKYRTNGDVSVVVASSELSETYKTTPTSKRIYMLDASTLAIDATVGQTLKNSSRDPGEGTTTI